LGWRQETIILLKRIKKLMSKNAKNFETEPKYLGSKKFKIRA
jgi:hypothetical protein